MNCTFEYDGVSYCEISETGYGKLTLTEVIVPHHRKP